MMSHSIRRQQSRKGRRPDGQQPPNAAIERDRTRKARRRNATRGHARREPDGARCRAADRAHRLPVVRGQEVERTWVDPEGSAVHFPDTKSGAQDRPLGKATLAVLGAYPELAGCPFVFPSVYGDSHYKQVRDVLQRLYIAARIEGVTAHTLRHTFNSVADDMGHSELTIAALLGHGNRGATQGDIHIDEGLRDAADRVSAKIADFLGGRASSVRDDGPASLEQPLAA